MSTILVKVDKADNQTVIDLIKKLGGNAMKVKDTVVEEILLGIMMDSTKSGKLVSKNTILKKLKTR